MLHISDLEDSGVDGRLGLDWMGGGGCYGVDLPG
jgi:hypothetical protein